MIVSLTWYSVCIAFSSSCVILTYLKSGFGLRKNKLYHLFIQTNRWSLILKIPFWYKLVAWRWQWSLSTVMINRYCYKVLHLYLFTVNLVEIWNRIYNGVFKKMILFLPCSISQFATEQSFKGFSLPSNQNSSNKNKSQNRKYSNPY
jgi:hypothetical protein